MKIKLLTSRAGPGGANAPGDVIDVPTDEAERLFAAGYAEPVRRRAPERAVRRPRAERAVK